MDDAFLNAMIDNNFRPNFCHAWSIPHRYIYMKQKVVDNKKLSVARATGFIDLHNDAITALKPQEFRRHVMSAETVGIHTIIVSVWATNLKSPMKKIKQYRKQIDSVKSGVTLLLHIEDAWFVDQSNIEELIALRPFSVGLTWNSNNALAGGAYSGGRLTDLGREVVRRLSEGGIVIDLAHLNRQSFYDVVELLRGKKLFCSHTCFDEVHPHARNLDRAQVQTIVDSDGLIGLTLVPEFLGGSVQRHIDYFIGNFGDRNLAIGTDFYGCDIEPNYTNYMNLPEGISHKNARRFIDDL